MANPTSAQVAGRYDGLKVGPRLLYSFETQAGIPIDGSNALLRDLSPFTLRLLPPDALLTAAARYEAGIDAFSSVGSSRGVTSERNQSLIGAQDAAIDLISAASFAANPNAVAEQVSQALARVSAIDAPETTLESFISTGKFLAGADGDTYITLSDSLTAADIAIQLKRILEAPPLTLLINPNNFTINYTNIQTYATATRYGYVFERWGEEQPTISFAGSTGGFIAGVAQASIGTEPFQEQVQRRTSSPSGLQWASRRNSAAWQNFIALYHFYRSNGYIYDTLRGSEAHLFVGAVAIDYDQWTYVGHIEGFNYSFQDTMPHRVEWDMEFKVDRMYDRSSPSAVVLPQHAPTASPSDPTYTGAGTGGTRRSLTFGDVISRASSADASLDEDTQFGTIPFGLLE